MDRTQEVLTKIDRVRGWLGGAGAAGLLLESSANFGWITAGGLSSVTVSEERGVAGVLITTGRAAILTSNVEAPRLADEQIPAGCFEVIEYPWHSPDRRERLISRLAGSETVVGDLPSAGRPAADPAFLELRRVLMEPEIERYRELGQDAASVVESACRSFDVKDRELDMAARVAAGCYERGMLPVVNLAAADDRISRYRHPLPTSKRAVRSMIVILTALRGGLHASLTRTVCFGEPDPEQEARHLACARIDVRMISKSKPGADLADILAAAIEQYAAEGHAGEWENHHQGGLTGYSGREVFGTPSSHYVLRENQALAWNPSVAGAKSEDTILVAGAQAEVLTATGHWPELEVELDGVTVKRPGLLIR